MIFIKGLKRPVWQTRVPPRPEQSKLLWQLNHRLQTMAGVRYIKQMYFWTVQLLCGENKSKNNVHILSLTKTWLIYLSERVHDGRKQQIYSLGRHYHTIFYCGMFPILKFFRIHKSVEPFKVIERFFQIFLNNIMLHNNIQNSNIHPLMCQRKILLQFSEMCLFHNSAKSSGSLNNINVLIVVMFFNTHVILKNV